MCVCVYVCVCARACPPPLRSLLCARDFRRRKDVARHRCMRWLKSAGGLAVHRCSVSTDSLAPAESISDESGYF